MESVWVGSWLHELMLSYEGTTSIRTQIEFKLLLKRILRILRGPTMMVPTEIKLIKSKIDSAFYYVYRFTKHNGTFLYEHFFKIRYIKRVQPCTFWNARWPLFYCDITTLGSVNERSFYRLDMYYAIIIK